MPIPDRPVDGAATETDWGQEIHDRVFAPAGCEASGTGIAVAGAILQLPIDTAVDDPGGFVSTASDRLEIPSDRGGLYDAIATLGSSGGVTGDGVRGFLRVNGAEVARAYEDSDTGVQTVINVIRIGLALAAGDIVTVHAVKRGSVGANPTVTLSSLVILRRGDEIGA